MSSVHPALTRVPTDAQRVSMETVADKEAEFGICHIPGSTMHPNYETLLNPFLVSQIDVGSFSCSSWLQSQHLDG